MRMRILTGIIAVAFALNANAQDGHFTQYSDAALYLNPALTGEFDGVFRAYANFRNQWGSLDQGYTSFSIAADGRFESKKKDVKSKLAAGLMVYNDRGGALRYGRLKSMLSLAYRVQLNRKHSLNFGLQGGFVQLKLNDAGFEWGNQYDGIKFDPEIEGENLRFVPKSYSDFAAGVNWSSGVGRATLSSADEKWFNIGVAVHHLSSNTLNDVSTFSETLERRYVGHARFHVGIKNSSLALEPSAYFSLQNEENEITFGNMCIVTMNEGARRTGYISAAYFGFGIFHRWKDAVMPAFSFRKGEYYFALSYDINVSALSQSTGLGGGPEFMFRYVIPQKLK